MTEAGAIYTIGHSTRTFEQFLTLLRREDVRHLVDVRRFPGSRRHPHFNTEPLAAALGDAGISYEHAVDLGGRRAASPDSRNLGWRNPSFRGYADHTVSHAFLAALDRVIATAERMPTAIMCAEAVPWRCHRTLIADALLARGWRVRHILDATTTDHTLTPFGVVRNGRVEYPSEQGEDLFSSASVE
jgi:uncharacterized protein (DUF488 family)